MKNTKKHMKNMQYNDRNSIGEPTEINNKSIEIPLYAPNNGITVKEYMMSLEFTRFERNFVAKCKEFLSKTDVDEYNTSFMDALITTMGNEACINIDVQRINHIETIRGPLDDMHTGDAIKCCRRLEQWKRDLVQVEKDIAKLERIYYKGTSYDECD